MTSILVIPGGILLDIQRCDDRVHIRCPECRASLTAVVVPGAQQEGWLQHEGWCGVYAKIQGAARRLARMRPDLDFTGDDL